MLGRAAIHIILTDNVTPNGAIFQIWNWTPDYFSGKSDQNDFEIFYIYRVVIACKIRRLRWRNLHNSRLGTTCQSGS